ncbi:hypothetical protein OSTOST_16300, partial [Ostertagia ostertagi]
MNLACLDYKDGDYDKALERFNNASSVMGYQPELAYAIALCHYRKKEYQQALKFITDIVDRGIKDHPGIDTNLANGFSKKLQYLLSQNPFPPETFANLLLLYCKYEYYDLAADVLAEEYPPHIQISYS